MGRVVGGCHVSSGRLRLNRGDGRGGSMLFLREASTRSSIKDSPAKKGGWNYKAIDMIVNHRKGSGEDDLRRG